MVGDTIHTEGQYKIVWANNKQGHVFHLMKDGVFFKKYSIANVKAEPTDKIISDVINVLKRFMI